MREILQTPELLIQRYFWTMKVKTLIVTLLILLWATVISAQTFDQNKLDQFFDRLSEKNEAMGSVIITKDGNALYTRSIGYAQINDTKKVPMTMSTRHRIGSITKMFTAVMILQLVEEGKLKLTDRLDSYFSQIPNADKITISHILSHRSGIHDITADPELRPRRRTTEVTMDEMLAIISKGASDFEPGSKYSYSNSGYFILGCLVEKLGGKSYEKAIKERIISKIGLNDTYVATGGINVSKNESFSYRRLSDWRQQPETHWSILYGSGSLISTPADMTRFVEALFDLKFFSQESFDLMKTIKDGYGLGMDTFTFAEKIFYGHTGGIDGFGSWLAYLPKEKLTIAYTTNGKVYPVSKILEGIVDIYFNRPFEIPSFESVAVSPEILQKYVGVYVRQGAPVKFTFTRDSRTLFISVNGGRKLPLEATSENKFKLESQGMTLEFDIQQNLMTLKRGGGTRVFTKEN